MVEFELMSTCGDILDIRDKCLILEANTGQSEVFYYKTKGDYHRYLAECATGKDAEENSPVIYKAASDFAMTQLPPTYLLHLGVALRLSVFYYKILNSSDHAYLLAQIAFEDAVTELSGLSQEGYKVSTFVM